MKTVFISYSHKDVAFAKNLAQRLKNAGIGVWLDLWEVKVGDRITAKINDAIRNQDCVIVVLSEHSIHSRWVEEEIGAALQKGRDVVLPIVLPGLQDSEIFPLLRDRRYADFRTDPEEPLRKLLEVFRPESEMLRNALDPFGRGRVVVLTGTSTRLYQQGARWTMASAGSVGAEFALKRVFEIVFEPKREELWNYADGMPLEGVRNGDNVFTIGSPKVNKFTAGFLAQCERPGIGSIWFVGREEWKDYGLYYALKGKGKTYRPSIDRINGQGTGDDYGLVVWAPLLKPHGGMTLLTAGCHTGASHAAAEIAVSPEFYEQLTEDEEIQLKFANKTPGFWAIVQVSCKDFKPDLGSIQICESGILNVNYPISQEAFELRSGTVWDSPLSGTYEGYLEQGRQDKEALRWIADQTFAEIGIHCQPIPAEELQRVMLECGIQPEENLFSRGIIERREE